MTAAPAPLSSRPLFGLAFPASLAALFTASAAAPMQGAQGAMDGIRSIAFMDFLYTFPIGPSPHAARRQGAFIRDHRGPTALIGLDAIRQRFSGRIRRAFGRLLWGDLDGVMNMTVAQGTSS